METSAFVERVSSLSDAELISKLDSLVADERNVCAAVLAHMAEVDARQLYHHDGYPSLYQYATGRLRLSRAAARHRITAARVVRRWPVALGMLAQGEIHLSGLGVLAAHLTDANHRELLADAAGKSKRAIEDLIAARFLPKDTLPFNVTEDVTAMGSATEPPPESELVTGPRREARGTTPVAEDTFHVSCTINGACRDKLAEAQALLAHHNPSGDIGVVLEAALDELLIKLRKRKFGETHAPRRAQRGLKSDSRHVPAEVKRAVSERDGRQCTFVGETGRRCSEVAMLEFHHETPFSRGGPTTASNVRLLCRTHNGYQAERDYGKEHMAAARASRLRAPSTVSRELAMAAAGALHRMGFPRSVARMAVKRAAGHGHPIPDIAELVRQSLRYTQPTTQTGYIDTANDGHA